MDERLAVDAINRYLELEGQLTAFLREVPPRGPNLKAWSPKLASVIKESCGLLESALKHITPVQVSIAGHQKRRKSLDIQDLAFLYAKKLWLTRRKVILVGAPKPEYRDPYKPWRNKVQRRFLSPPYWWTIHNRLKHDELASMQKATINTAIDALAGLVLALGSAPEFTRALMRQDLLHWSYVHPDAVVGWALGGFPQNRPVVLLTKLFAVVLGGPQLPKDIEDFRPLTHARSHVLIPFFAKF